MAAFLLLACAASARTLLKEARPSQCDAKSGKWDRNDINCDFTCPSGGWELDCKAKNATSVPCKVDKDKAPDSADIKFTCTVPTPGQVNQLTCYVFSDSTHPLSSIIGNISVGICFCRAQIALRALLLCPLPMTPAFQTQSRLF